MLYNVSIIISNIITSGWSGWAGRATFLELLPITSLVCSSPQMQFHILTALILQKVSVKICWLYLIFTGFKVPNWIFYVRTVETSSMDVSSSIGLQQPQWVRLTENRFISSQMRRRKTQSGRRRVSWNVDDIISSLLNLAGDKDPWVRPNLPPIKSDKKKEATEKDKDVESGGGSSEGCEEETFASKMIKSVFCLM